MSVVAPPWLSILLPVYKVEAYVLACAESILSQADGGVELVFVDDASPDGSATLIEALTLAYPGQVRLLRHEQNRGISAARNTLLDAARGDYLWFIDPDDLLESGVLQRLKVILRSQAPDLLMCDFRAFDDAGDGSPTVQRSRYAHVPSFSGPERGMDRQQLLKGLFKLGRFHPWSKVVRRELWPQALRFPVGRIFEDMQLIPRLALRVRSYVHVPEVWVAYRQRPGSAMASLSTERMDDWMSALEGFGAELNLQFPACDESSRFEVAHFCARTFIRASRRTLKSGYPITMLWRFAEQFEASAPLSTAELLRAYLRRGRLLRALQLHLTLRRAITVKG